MRARQSCAELCAMRPTVGAPWPCSALRLLALNDTVDVFGKVESWCRLAGGGLPTRASLAPCATARAPPGPAPAPAQHHAAAGAGPQL